MEEKENKVLMSGFLLPVSTAQRVKHFTEHGGYKLSAIYKEALAMWLAAQDGLEPPKLGTSPLELERELYGRENGEVPSFRVPSTHKRVPSFIVPVHLFNRLLGDRKSEDWGDYLTRVCRKHLNRRTRRTKAVLLELEKRRAGFRQERAQKRAELAQVKRDAVASTGGDFA